METIRRRRVELLTGGMRLDTGNPVESAALMALDARTAAWLTADPSGSPADMGAWWVVLGESRGAAIAWATPASRHYKHDGVALRIAESLRSWAASYGPESSELGNWWHWEIGVPHLLTDIGLLLDGTLDSGLVHAIDAFVARFAGDPNVRTKMPELRETGANRADKAAIAVKHGALLGAGERIQAGRDAMSDLAGNGLHSLFTYVQEGDGLYRDGSYIQHDKLAYAGAYGLVTLSELADLMFLLAGSDWAVDEVEAGPFLDSVELSYSPFITDGYMMDCTRGRGVSRSFATDEHMGAVAAGAVARLSTVLKPAPGPEPGTTAVFQGLVKGWLDRHPALPLDHLPLNQLGLLRAIATDPAIAATPPLEAHVHTPDQERVVHRSATWQASFSLSSHRRGRFEWGNGENMRGWHQGDGHLQLFTNADRGAYSGNYWATSDPLHLPGVTNVLRAGGSRDEAGTGIPPATAAWAGGVAWGANQEDKASLGTVGMDAEHLPDGLSGVKSWFVLENSIVALGAGFTGTHGHRVHTTVEARLLGRPDAAFTLTPSGSTPAGTTPTWAHLENVAGYVLFDAPGLRHERVLRSGSWRDVNVDGSSDLVSGHYQLLYFDHGTDPEAASYGYSIHPGASPDDVAEAASNPGYIVLANTPQLQAIELPERRLVMANFFSAALCPPSTVAPGGVRADGSAAVVLGEIRGEAGQRMLRIGLSDPAQRNEPLTLTVGREAGGLVEAPAGTVLTTGPGRFTLTVPTAGSRGHTQSLTLRLP